MPGDDPLRPSDWRSLATFGNFLFAIAIVFVLLGIGWAIEAIMFAVQTVEKL